MDQRFAPAIAVASMSKKEKPLLEHKPLLYCRYIDDCCIICLMQAEIDACFDLLNKQQGSEAEASLLVNTSGATLTTGGPLTSRFRGYQGSEEGDDAETLARIKINNNLGSA
ncbi:hypothetical protein RB195_003408 [Necator americanus]|uniref:Reverse transcriptase domain-containing protein n=1 Tax=Necator americanus TaxID=51031 RepID=A0ABR1DNF3_NECAM